MRFCQHINLRLFSYILLVSMLLTACDNEYLSVDKTAPVSGTDTFASTAVIESTFTEPFTTEAYAAETSATEPITEPSTTEAPVTPPPVTNPPTTNPPETEPPAAKPPETEPPVTNPPETEPPVTNPPETEPPVTNPPETEPPVTNPPETEPPATIPPISDPPVMKPENSKIPFLDHQSVSIKICIMTPSPTIYTGRDPKYDSNDSITYGSMLHITQLHGSLNSLWGRFHSGWIHLDCTDFYVNSAIYQNYVASMNIFNNNISQALPLTVVQKLALDHFRAPLPDGKTTKKALVIGYDGFRVDGLNMLTEQQNSAVMLLKQHGGLYHAFTGGITGYKEQLTVSAPSWMAATTGGWADYNGVNDNGIPKNSASTFMTELAQQGKNSAIVVAWPDNVQAAYQPDIAFAAQNNLPIQYIRTDSDAATYERVLSFLQSKPEPPVETPENPGETTEPPEQTPQDPNLTPETPDNSSETPVDSVDKTEAPIQASCSTAQDPNNPDILFTVFEQPDAAGHASGYGNYVEEYITACQNIDNMCFSLLKTISQRSTYESEDWLIIITTDHGGVAYGHGSQMTFDRLTWIACNKKIPLVNENLNYALLP